MKKAPLKLQKDFISQQKQTDKQVRELDALKKRIRKLHAKGYEFDLLLLVDQMKFCPPWKKLHDELLRMFMNASERREWNKKIAKRYPAKAVAPTIRVRKGVSV